MATALTGEIIPRRVDSRVKLARQEARYEREKFARESIKDVLLTVLNNPVAVCLGLLGANRLAYMAGLYKQLEGEQQTSILGGPVWFEIGDSLPMDQENYQKINAIIIGLSAGVAAGGVDSVANLLKAVK